MAVWLRLAVIGWIMTLTDFVDIVFVDDFRQPTKGHDRGNTITLPAHTRICASYQ